MKTTVVVKDILLQVEINLIKKATLVAANQLKNSTLLCLIN